MKNKLLFASIIAALSLSLFGCGCSKENTEPVVEKEDRIVLNASKVDLSFGESFQLLVSYYDVQGIHETTYQSLDEGVVKVDENGLVTTIGEGSTDVEVYKGNAVEKCTFNVTFDNQVPCLTVVGVDNHYLGVDLTTTFDLEVKAKFGGVLFDVTNVTYDITALDGEGHMDDKTFVPTKKGFLNIEINASFNDYKMYAYFLSVEIKESIVILLRNEDTGLRDYNEVNLFTLESYKGKHFMTEFSPVLDVNINGVDKSNEATYELINDNNAVNFDESKNLITANKQGTATIVIHYLTYTKEIPVTVDYVYANDYISEDLIIDASVGEFPNEEIFASFPGDNEILKATSLDKETEYEVVDGKVLGIQSHNFVEQSILVYNNVIAFVVTFKAYAKIIRTGEDLKDFNIYYGNNDEARQKVMQFQNDGYYIVANNIDCSGITYSEHTRMLGLGTGQINSSCGFVGTFDGQGYTISNFEAPKGGLFLILGNKAVVKNVAFKDAVLNTAPVNDKFVLATHVYGAKVQNVYINSSSDIKSQNNAMVVACFTSSSNVVNCLFEYTGNVTTTLNYGSIMHVADSSVAPKAQFNNVYLVSTTPMLVSGAFYCDAFEFEGDAFKSRDFRKVETVVHYLTYEDMLAAENDFSSFDETYWDYSSGILTWIIK